MTINKSVTLGNYDEFIKLIQRLIKEKRAFNFNGNINHIAQKCEENFSINWTSEEEI